MKLYVAVEHFSVRLDHDKDGTVIRSTLTTDMEQLSYYVGCPLAGPPTTIVVTDGEDRNEFTVFPIPSSGLAGWVFVPIGENMSKHMCGRIDRQLIVINV